MELKKWNLYDNSEKKSLLIHWFTYYGKMIYSLQEFMDYQELIKEKADDVFKYAIIAYLNKESSQKLLMAIRNNEAHEFLKIICDRIKNDEKLNSLVNESENSLLPILVETYNHPEPSNIDIESTKKQIINYLKKRGL